MAFESSEVSVLPTLFLVVILAITSFFFTFLRAGVRPTKPSSATATYRTRTLRLLINTGPATDAEHLISHNLRSALARRVRISSPKSEPTLSMARDLRNRFCATLTLNEDLSQLFPKDVFDMDLELDSGSIIPVQVTADTHFLGITTLYDGATGEDAVDLLAIPGLGSHAFGSFKSTTSGENWLRDYLPKTLPNVRVLLYGYDTSLTNASAKESITDLARRLLVSIHTHRKHGSVKATAGQLHSCVLTTH